MIRTMNVKAPIQECYETFEEYAVVWNDHIYYVRKIDGEDTKAPDFFYDTEEISLSDIIADKEKRTKSGWSLPLNSKSATDILVANDALFEGYNKGYAKGHSDGLRESYLVGLKQGLDMNKPKYTFEQNND